MRKIFLMLLMSVPACALAALVPDPRSETKGPSIEQTDSRKQKIVQERKVIQGIGVDAVKNSGIERYQGVLTMDNLKAIENMSRLLQDNPNLFVNEASGGVGNSDFDRRVMGTDEIVSAYVRTEETDDPIEKLANLRVPELTGSFGGARASREEAEALRAQALEQLEHVSHKRLGEKQAPLQMVPTVDDLWELGIDPRRLPKGWEKTVQENSELTKNLREKSQEKKANPTKSSSAK